MTEAETVRKLAQRIIFMPAYRDEIEFLCREFSVSEEDIITAWLHWDTGIHDYGNEVYQSIALRFAMHLHNYIEGNWHEKRQTEVLRLIRQLSPRTICEVGFGTPQRYIREYVLRDPAVSLTLLDFEQEAILFGRALLGFRKGDYSRQIKLDIYDMNSMIFPGLYDLYIFQDSVEHVKDPTRYLASMVEQAPEGAHYLFSLPIEVDRHVPEHFIFWKDAEDALSWLEQCGLKVLESSKIPMNPELDVFARFLHEDFFELMVLAKKA